MMDESAKKQFMDQFNRFFSNGATALGREVQDQVKAAMSATFDRMDLVTRDEFEAQKAVLMRSRELLHQLELQVAELEAMQYRPPSAEA